MLLIALLAACGGTPPAQPPAGAPATEPGASSGAARPASPVDLLCPEGTTPQSATTGKGEERWCDRGGVMHGPYLRLYPDGSRAVRGEYDNSQPHADWVWWHENGQESSKGKYIKGRQTGPWTWWHPNGNRSEEGDFLGGRKAGQWTRYFESARKQEAGIYHNDMKDGVWTYFLDDEDATVQRTERWQGGAMVEEKVLVAVPADGSEAPEEGGKAGKRTPPG